MFEAFGAAVPLLVAGALGGLVRGLLALRKAFASGSIAGPALTVLGIDIVTSIIIGSVVSLYLHDLALAIFGAGLDFIHVDPGAKVTTAGFIAGLVAITLVGFITDTVTKRAELKAGTP